MPNGCTCLLIGNSRWHWATRTAEGWVFAHTNPDPLRLDGLELVRWAAVGPVPVHPVLSQTTRLGLEDLPLKGMPPWLGVDRALAAWAATTRAVPLPTQGGVLVADAGTVLSLTRVTSEGEFAGGQLAAGFGLQLRAMAAGTRDLPAPGSLHQLPSELFPHATLAAMQQGAIQSLLGLLLEAQRSCSWPLWICGGDAPLLIDSLRQQGAEVIHAPDLVMEGMVTLVS